MATFPERGQITSYNLLNPFVAAFVAPTDVDATFVQGAVILRRQVEAAVEDIAYDKVDAAITTPPAVGSQESENLILAQLVVAGRVSSTNAALKLILGDFDSLTPTQLFDKAVATDAAVKAFLVTVWPVMANFYHKPQNQ